MKNNYLEVNQAGSVKSDHTQDIKPEHNIFDFNQNSVLPDALTKEQ